MTILANTAMTEGLTLEDYNTPDVTFAARRGATPATVIADMFPEADAAAVRRGRRRDPGGAERQRPRHHGVGAHARPRSAPVTPTSLCVPFDESVPGRGRSLRRAQG